MPPRRRGRAAAGNAAPANQVPAAPANAPPRSSDLLPADFPLFPTAERSRAAYFNALTAAQCQLVPVIAAQKANMVAINVWDVCARKKTQRPKFQLEVQIKRAIFEFMGADTFTIKPGTGPLPSDNAGALTIEPAQSAPFMRAKLEQEQKEAAAKIFGTIARAAAEGAVTELREGFAFLVRIVVEKSGVAEKLAKHLLSATEGEVGEEVGTRVRSATGTHWGRIFAKVPQLRPLLEEAGYVIGDCYVTLVGAKKEWALEIRWA